MDKTDYPQHAKPCSQWWCMPKPALSMSTPNTATSKDPHSPGTAQPCPCRRRLGILRPPHPWRATRPPHRIGLRGCRSADGRDGVAKAKVERPDLILMDIQLPVLDS